MLTYAYSIYMRYIIIRLRDAQVIMAVLSSINETFNFYFIPRDNQSIKSFLECIQSMTRKHTEYFTIISGSEGKDKDKNPLKVSLLLGIID